MSRFCELITKNLNKLVQATNCSNLILSEFEQCFDSDLIQELKQDMIRNKQSYKFWDAVRLHKENLSIEKLITAFKNQKQSDVVIVLEEIEKELKGFPNDDVTSKSMPAVRPANNLAEIVPSSMKVTSRSPQEPVCDLSLRDFIKSIKNRLFFNDSLPEDFVDPEVVRPVSRMNHSTDFYQLPTGFKGLFLLINIVTYKDNSNRRGAAVDTRRLQVVFESLGYEVILVTGSEKTFTHEMFSNIINKFKQRCAMLEVNSFAVFLGGHGANGILEMSDGSEINLESEVFSKLCTPPENYHAALGKEHWKNIPKMFFIQACRSDPGDDIPEINNCLISYACESGKVAWRSETDGSYYVYALTDVLATSATKKDLVTMLDTVSQYVESYSWARNKRGKDTQKPEYTVKGEFQKLYFNMLPFEYV